MIPEDELPRAADGFHQLFLVRKDAALFLGIDQFSLHRDLEDPSTRLNESYFSRQLCFNPLRQTGGSCAIASLVAKFDDDQHVAPPIISLILCREYSTG